MTLQQRFMTYRKIDNDSLKYGFYVKIVSILNDFSLSKHFNRAILRYSCLTNSLRILSRRAAKLVKRAAHARLSPTGGKRQR